jgi:hypothetical protein
MNQDFKNCHNCKYENIPESDKPCSKCFNSFCGMPFNEPSEYEENKILK